MLEDLVRTSRSYRRFDESVAVSRETLESLVGLARLCPSGANHQPLKYLLSWEPERNQLIYPNLVWAGYLPDWPGPAEGERPTGFIFVLGDTRIVKAFGVDPGIVAQTMMLGAVEKGLGGCILGSIRRPEVRAALKIALHFEILLVLALGKPVEKVAVEDLAEGDGVKYWRDSDGVHHVPKRLLEDLILN